METTFFAGNLVTRIRKFQIFYLLVSHSAFMCQWPNRRVAMVQRAVVKAGCLVEGLCLDCI